MDDYKMKEFVSANPSRRRAFLKIGGSTAAALLGGAVDAQQTATPAVPVPAPAMPTRNLGQTGYQVGIFSLGGQAALERPNNQAVAVPIIERALDLGVNYLDTSSIYGGPARWSERYIGEVMRRRRAEAFLASKTKERTRDGSLRMLEESLKLLQTDHLDLWQLHDIGLAEDVEAVFAKGGAMEALRQAHEQKIVRHLGITGHYRPEALAECIRRFPFDTILMALSAADHHHFSFTESLLPLAVGRRMGIIGMKIPGRGRLLATWTPPPEQEQRRSWEGAVIATRPGALHMREALYYVLSLPVSTVIVGCDTIQQLEENVQLAREFTPLSEQQMRNLAAKAEPVSKQALFFRFVSRA
jgi:aryl-alcohol dehydrogenase-like predicted oxidoreductase